MFLPSAPYPWETSVWPPYCTHRSAKRSGIVSVGAGTGYRPIVGHRNAWAAFLCLGAALCWFIRRMLIQSPVYTDNRTAGLKLSRSGHDQASWGQGVQSLLSVSPHQARHVAGPVDQLCLWSIEPDGRAEAPTHILGLTQRFASGF